MPKKPSLSIGVVDKSRPEKKLTELLIDVGTPQSLIGTPKSSDDSPHSSVSTSELFPYTNLLKEEIFVAKTPLYLKIKGGALLYGEPHPRLFREDSLRGGLKFTMKTYKYSNPELAVILKDSNPELAVILKEYTFESTSQSTLLEKLFEEKIFKEIYLQQKAKQIAKEKCRVNIPSIIEFGKFSESSTSEGSTSEGSTSEGYTSEGYTTHFYIIMQFIEGVSPVTLTDCESLKTKVEAIDKCLQDEGVYHNDLNKGNVIFQSDKSIAFIDFGEATEVVDRFDNNIFKCNKVHDFPQEEGVGHGHEESVAQGTEVFTPRVVDEPKQSLPTSSSSGKSSVGGRNNSKKSDKKKGGRKIKSKKNKGKNRTKKTEQKDRRGK